MIGFGLLTAIAISTAVRRTSWPLAIGFWSPAYDAVFLIYQHVTSWHALLAAGYGEVGLSVSYAMTCMLLAASGALRLTRGRVVWTTALALVALNGGAWAVSSALHPGVLRFASGAVLVMGLFSLRISHVVQRAVNAEVAKQVLNRFLPARVVQRAHSDPMSLLVPRSVEATVVFTDLRGFTAMAEGMSPSDVMTFLSQVHGVAAEVVHAESGTIDKFTGDGMLAVFGVFETDQPHATQAVRAAIELRRRMKTFNLVRSNAGEIALALGIGVHTGSVVTGALGSAERLEFTVVGDTVNIASRLEALTKERGIDLLISEETKVRATGVELEQAGEAQLRGRAGLTRLYTSNQA